MDIGQGDIFLSALYLWYISANITKNTLNRPEICCAWWSSKQVNWARRGKKASNYQVSWNPCKFYWNTMSSNKCASTVFFRP